VAIHILDKCIKTKLTDKALKGLKMEKSTKDSLNEINSMDLEYYTT